MLVYGDRTEWVDSAEWLSLLEGQLREISGMAFGIGRHSKLAGTLIGAGQLLQGIADEGLPCPEVTVFVHELAQCFVRSADSGFMAMGELPRVPAIEHTTRLQLRTPEGFAFYAVYPEAYVAAARRLRLDGRPRVIGIRSIGTTLGAVVAAAIGAPHSISVRPFGDPFARQVELPEEVVDPSAHYVIVDEGPGLSGSSFGSVADWLEGRGVPLDRIAFVSSHSGDLGSEASTAHRARWAVAQRVAAEFDGSFLEQHLGRLDPYVAGGAWQRTKFLARRNGEMTLVKFAGIGTVGERKLAMARALHAAGYTAEPLGLLHGFMLERFEDAARPLYPDERPVEDMGRYIGARARLFPANEHSGADIEQLRTMCRRNIALGLGEAAGGRIDRFQSMEFTSGRTRVRTDNKMEPREWLRTAAGGLLKTDALDHHDAHDLIGSQYPEWDVAGCIEEFQLEPVEAERLIASAAIEIDPFLLRFYRVAYAAFRLGQSELAHEPSSAQRYARSIEHLLHQDS